MTAELPPLISHDVTAHCLEKSTSDIPISLTDFESLETRKECTLQTRRSQDLESVKFLYFEIKGEPQFMVLSYNQSGRIITYVPLESWDKDSIMTVHP